MSTPKIHPTTAQFANFPVLEACALLEKESKEFFSISMDYVQLCPQTPDVFTEETLAKLHEAFPKTRFQLHANVLVQPGRRMLDASSYTEHSHWYYERLAELSHFMKAPAYSLHSGYRRNCSMQTLFQNLEALQSLFEIPVLVEGMYPTKKGPEEYLISTWEEYLMVMNSGLPYAIDLSHLNIVAKQEGKRPDIVHELIVNTNCREVHISHNNGIHDAHRIITEQIWKNVWWKKAWLAALSERPPKDLPVHFTEGLHQTRTHTGNVIQHTRKHRKRSANPLAIQNSCGSS